MDNRFGVKDFFLFTLLTVLIIVVLMAMKQFDRQYTRVVTLERQTNELARELAQLSRQVAELPGMVAALPRAGGGAAAASGGAAAAGETSPANASGEATGSRQVGPALPGSALDPFAEIRQIRSLPNFAEGDWLIHNLGARLGKITPLVSSDIYGSTVQARVIEPLIVRCPDTLKWQPLLAERWEVHEDGLGVTYYLRRNVRFSDGVAMTAHDVKFTFDRIMEPDLDAARSRSYLVENGVTVEVVDDFTVKFRLTRPYFLMLSVTGGQPVLPKHFYERYTARQHNDNPGLLMGTGPYRLDDPDKWRPGQRLILLRNERYWGVPPALSRIVYLEVQEETVYATMLRNGELDYAGVTPEQFTRLRENELIRRRHNELEFQSMLGGYSYIAWNQERGGQPTPFADRRVRQAMTMLVDRERMARELWLGYATVATGPFSRRGMQADTAIEPWPFDPDRALSLLKEAGFEDRNNDGVLEGPDGRPMRFEFMFPAGSAFSERIALFIRDQLARGGVVLELRATDWPVMLERLKRSQYDVTSLGWTSSVESDPFQIFHSSQRGDAGDNRTNYANEELDRLIELARKTVDDEARMQIWHRVHRILHEDQPYTFLLERKSLAFYDKRFQNVRLTKMGTNFMAAEPRVPPWFVPSELQRYSQN